MIFFVIRMIFSLADFIHFSHNKFDLADWGGLCRMANINLIDLADKNLVVVWRPVFKDKTGYIVCARPDWKCRVGRAVVAATAAFRVRPR